MPHPKYDEWKLATPWDNMLDEIPDTCSECGDECETKICASCAEELDCDA